MKDIRKVPDEYAAGKISRRAAFRSLLAAGLTGPAALAALNLKTNAQTLVPDLRSSDKIDTFTRSLKKLVDDPAFSSQVSSVVGAQTKDERVKKARDLFREWSEPNVLKAKGLDPENTKLTFRVFEKRDAAQSIVREERTVASQSYTFIPTSEVQADLLRLPLAAQPLSQDSITRFPIGSSPNLPLPQFPPDLRSKIGSKIDPSKITVCISSGPGGVICGSVGGDI
jgi:hypothetical protein